MKLYFLITIFLLGVNLFNCKSQVIDACQASGLFPIPLGSSLSTTNNENQVQATSSSSASATASGGKESDFEVKKDNSRALKFPGRIYLYDKYLYINDLAWGIHIYDNSNPEAPIKFISIQIPGNYEIAIKDNILYADSNIGLLALKIKENGEPEIKAKFSEIFGANGYYYQNPNSNTVIDSSSTLNSLLVQKYKDCGKKMDVLPFSTNSSSASSSSSTTGTATASTGKSGSLSRFAVKGDYLYVLSYSSVYVLKISSPEKPVFIKSSPLSTWMETVFLFKEYLLFGASDGMYIYDIKDLENPSYLSKFTHGIACDPVVAQGDYAYVTLRQGCGSNATNQLDIINISNIKNPQFIKSYPMAKPYGLGIDGNSLFICDIQEGLKVYNVQDPNNIRLLSSRNETEIYDVILSSNKSVVTGKGGVFQYNYENINNLLLLSKIPAE